MSKGLRITLHIFQILFLLFGLLCFTLVCIEMFAFDGSYTWNAEDQMMSIVTPTSVLLAIAFSPGLWHVAMKNMSGAVQQPMGPPPGMPPQQGGPMPPFAGQPSEPSGPPSQGQPPAGPPRGQQQGSVYGQPPSQSPYPPQQR